MTCSRSFNFFKPHFTPRLLTLTHMSVYTVGSMSYANFWEHPGEQEIDYWRSMITESIFEVSKKEQLRKALWAESTEWDSRQWTSVHKVKRRSVCEVFGELWWSLDCRQGWELSLGGRWGWLGGPRLVDGWTISGYSRGSDILCDFHRSP